jgi:hypothetical protein
VGLVDELVCKATALSVRLLKMKKSYNIYEVTKTICVEVDKGSNGSHIHFDFTIMILKIKDEEYAVQVYRNETVDLRTLSGVYSHDEILVRDLFLVDNLLRFKSGAAAIDFINQRLSDLFG